MGIKSTIKGAKETINLMRGTAKANKESKANIDKIAIQLAQKNNIKRTGSAMLPSTLKSEQAMGKLSKNSQAYLKDKAEIKKAKLKHYGFKK